MNTERQLADQAARDTIETCLETNLFVEAGAGAGKTSSLVGRILALVASGIELDSIAAITFTQKAAAELRHRVRESLVTALDEAMVTDADATGGDAESVIVERYRRALDQLDAAPIGTLHAFARRLLDEYPIAALLPPGFAVMDEIESNVRFDDRWETFLDQILSTERPDVGPLGGGSNLYEVCTFDNFGIINKTATMPSGFERIAHDFQANWDLLDRVDRSDPGELHLDVSHIINAARTIATTECPEGDTQAKFCAEIGERAEDLARAPTKAEQLQALAPLQSVAKTAMKRGDQTKWKRFGTTYEAVQGAQRDLVESIEQLHSDVYAYRKRLVGAILSRWVLDGVRRRQRDGLIEFHDLLVFARQLLAGHPTVRASLHQRYVRVLLDEFQDTDPIQLEIAVRLTADPDDPHQDGDWRELIPLPGRLFIVGDPKQSIYRFRRADISQYLQAAAQLQADTVTLSANFRSTDAVIDWVNTVFDRVIQADTDIQPGYVPLTAQRRGPRDYGSVRVLGADEDLVNDEGKAASAETLRLREAQLVADTVVAALNQGWPVRDPDSSSGTRPCQPGDICILLPARTSLNELESALRDRGVPYRAENSSVVYATVEVRHLVLALRAMDDPTDEIKLIAALRSPLYGLSDPALLEWRSAGGRWSIWSEPPAGMEDHPVALAFADLSGRARVAWEMTPADVIADLVDQRRVLDAALDSDGSRDVWRRVRFMIEQARAWSDAGGHGLRRYLGWVERQASEARAGETILPEHDQDAVRIMTIHAAKGLEFPITVLSGMTTRPRRQGGYSVAWTFDDWAIRQPSQDPEFDSYKPIDEQMSDAERRRLLYVACTRAVDHLVVSLVHPQRGGGESLSNAELLLDAGAAEHAEPYEPAPATYRRPSSDPVVLANSDHQAWQVERRARIAEADQVRSLSATALAKSGTTGSPRDDPGLEKEPVDLDLPPWQRGRYGTAVGRAVHAVLQYCDLATGDDIDTHAAAQCAAEGIFGMDELVAQLARSAIQAPIVHTAVNTSHHRELFVAAPVGDKIIEGYIDLFVETPDGGIIVDYKTDTFDDDAERQARIATYRLQLAAYGVALERVLGKRVEAAVLVRCRADGPAEQITVPDWDSALVEVDGITRSFEPTAT